MANIGSHGAHTVGQVKATKPEAMPTMTADGLVHLTLTLTSDGRLLRKLGWKRKGSPRAYWNYSGYKVLTKVNMAGLPRDRAEIDRRLGIIARRMGYQVVA